MLTSMVALKEFDCVKIVRLLQPNRQYDGTAPVRRSPCVGDTGIIVYIYASDGEDTIYAVENVEAEGHTIWLADFLSDEIAACS